MNAIMGTLNNTGLMAAITGPAMLATLGYCARLILRPAPDQTPEDAA